MNHLVDDYIAYLKTINYFSNLPLWKKELYSYTSKAKITLPSIDTTNILETLPSPNKKKHKF